MVTVAQAGCTLTALVIAAFLAVPGGGQAGPAPGPGSLRLDALIGALIALACMAGLLITRSVVRGRERRPARRTAAHAPSSWDQPW